MKKPYSKDYGDELYDSFENIKPQKKKKGSKFDPKNLLKQLKKTVKKNLTDAHNEDNDSGNSDEDPLYMTATKMSDAIKNISA